MSMMSEAFKKAGFNVECSETPAYRQVDFETMTKKERKRAVAIEVSRLENKIPYMWTEFGRAIAQYNFENPENPITDEFLIRVVDKGEKMDIWGKDAKYCSHLQTNNSATNYKSLVALMGEELTAEMNSFGVSWGYYASLYEEIYRKKFEF